jgi:hypothetical protein
LLQVLACKRVRRKKPQIAQKLIFHDISLRSLQKASAEFRFLHSFAAEKQRFFIDTADRKWAGQRPLSA